MVKALKRIDLKRARLVPSSVFADPDEVLACEDLSLAQKLAILRRWEFDARRVAGYGGAAAEAAGILHRVRRALQALTEQPQAAPEGIVRRRQQVPALASRAETVPILAEPAGVPPAGVLLGQAGADLRR